jgi:hypothetical protein
MEGCRKIFIKTNGINELIRQISTNEMIVPESLDLCWSWNFASLQTGEIRSSMVRNFIL